MLKIEHPTKADPVRAHGHAKDGVPLGAVRMQNVLFRMLGTPGRIRWAGRRLGQDNEAVYGELGVSPERLPRAWCRSSEGAH